MPQNNFRHAHATLACFSADLASVNCVRKRVDGIISILTKYETLIKAYISDFFTLMHWDKLAGSWQECLSLIQLHELSSLLDAAEYRSRVVWPLSLLAFWITVHHFALDRSPPISCRDGKCCLISQDGDEGKNTSLLRVFEKNVKQKKRHEICRLAKIINDLGKTCHPQCDNVVDIGAGQGHLSRLLAFEYGLRVISLDSMENHTLKSLHYDRLLKSRLLKTENELLVSNSVSRKVDSMLPPLSAAENNSTAISPLSPSVTTQNDNPSYVVAKIRHDTTVDEFVDALTTAERLAAGHRSVTNENSKIAPFVMAGLHACGDLTTTMLRLFCLCPVARGLVSVSCCYMKCDNVVPSDSPGGHGYPMSRYLTDLGYELSWEAKEMACHFVDDYRAKLRVSDQSALRSQCYRAVLQEIIAEKAPRLQHGRIKLTNKKSRHMSFRDYAESTLKRLGLDTELTVQQLQRAEERMTEWRKVVAFSTLRLALAPLVETLLILDRVLYLAENNIDSCLVPAFSPVISPRNIVLIAAKK